MIRVVPFIIIRMDDPYVNDSLLHTSLTEAFAVVMSKRLFYKRKLKNRISSYSNTFTNSKKYFSVIDKFL